MKHLIDDQDKKESRNDAKFFRSTAISRSKYKCEACGLFCPFIITVHHKIAVKDGGNGYPENLICLCPNCHTIIEKIKTSLCENQYFDDWIFSTFGEDIYDKILAIAYNEIKHE